MGDNVCAICFRRVSAHTVEQALECNRKFGHLELERLANKECYCCGVSADIIDPVTNQFLCHGCLQWLTQLNDE